MMLLNQKMFPCSTSDDGINSRWCDLVFPRHKADQSRYPLLVPVTDRNHLRFLNNCGRQRSRHWRDMGNASLVWTQSIARFRKVAIIAKQLEAIRWAPVFQEPRINRMSATNFSAMLIAIVENMINGKEFGFGFSAADTFASIAFDYAPSDRSSLSFSLCPYLSSVVHAPSLPIGNRTSAAFGSFPISAHNRPIKTCYRLDFQAPNASFLFSLWIGILGSLSTLFTAKLRRDLSTALWFIRRFTMLTGLLNALIANRSGTFYTTTFLRDVVFANLKRRTAGLADFVDCGFSMCYALTGHEACVTSQVNWSGLGVLNNSKSFCILP